eukprot:gnl/TRDRNA2_/TRDRNA2_156337_c0_seq1.p1 gnl/TRDRNA2_/TRDRNA2_156337_c0~~gnl/TRDRNA2_/TRDRNA2_156337_c0_seq1.p1  ORF type:complete len:420 (-),score=57.20 gnl/TRDRNA2_/TRDRNA2_156337_c0_seq1:242-1384(-)
MTGPQEVAYETMVETVKMLTSVLLGLRDGGRVCLMGWALQTGARERDDELTVFPAKRLQEYDLGCVDELWNSEYSEQAKANGQSIQAEDVQPIVCARPRLLSDVCENLNREFKDHAILGKLKVAEQTLKDHDVRLALPCGIPASNFVAMLELGFQITFEMEIEQLSNEQAMEPLFPTQSNPQAGGDERPGFAYWEQSLNCLRDVVRRLQDSDGEDDSGCKREVGNWLKEGTVQFGGALLFFWRLLVMTWIEGALLGEAMSHVRDWGRSPPGIWKTEFGILARNSGIEILLEEGMTLVRRNGWDSPHRILQVIIGALKDWASSQWELLRWVWWATRPGELTIVEEKCLDIEALLANQGQRSDKGAPSTRNFSKRSGKSCIR